MIRSRAAVLVAVLLAGCSSIPEGGDPSRDLADLSPGLPKLGSVAVAPISTISLGEDERDKGWPATEIFDRDAYRESLDRALGARTFAAARPAAENAVADAWSNKDEFVLNIAIKNITTTGPEYLYERRFPAAVIWFMWMFPAWWIATESYTLSLEAHVSVASGETGVPLLAPWVEECKVEGTFDEWDRGFRVPMGQGVFIGPGLDADKWEKIVRKLEPAAQRQLLAQVARGVDARLRAALRDPTIVEKRRKTLVLSVGVTSYADPIARPPVAHAAGDARAVAAELRRLGAPDHHVVELVDRDATVPALKAKIADHLGRARDGDRVIFFFAGYGTRGKNGQPLLLLREASGAPGAISLDELGSLLSNVRGDKLVLLDTSFDGHGRSIPGGAATAANDLAPLERAPGVTTIAAAGSGETALAPDYLARGLLTFHLIRSLRELGTGGPPTSRWLFGKVLERVSGEAGILGERQSPRASGLDRGFLFRVRTGARP